MQGYIRDFIKKTWREEIKKTFNNDPLLCPKCKIEMELVGICYEGSESYPTEELKPVEPPPLKKYSQQERMALIITLIKNNHNEYIEHLKIQGEAYEPKNGEIKYLF